MPAPNESLPTKPSIVLACGDCGGRPRGFRDDLLWPLCRCPGEFQPHLAATVYPTLVPAVYDLESNGVAT